MGTIASKTRDNAMDVGGFEGGQTWGAVGAAIVAAVVGGYKLMRGVKADNRQDEAVVAIDQRMRTTIADLDARLTAERGRADILAKERMEFSAQLGRLSGLYEALEDKVKTLEADKKRLETELQKLEEDFECIKSLNHHLVEESTQFRSLMVAEGLEQNYERMARIIRGTAEKCAPARLPEGGIPLQSRG